MSLTCPDRSLVLLFALAALLGLSACDLFGHKDDDKTKFNPNIIRLVYCCPLVGETSDGFALSGNYSMAVWRGDRLYTISQLRELQIKPDFTIGSVKEFWPLLLPPRLSWGFVSFVEANPSGSKLLLVESTYRDVSAGFLYEYEPDTNALHLLRDSTYNVSSAIYWPGDESRILYYSYGRSVGHEPIGEGAGYYLLDRATGRDSLVLAYQSPIGPSEHLNGFDVHPDGTKLLIGAVQAEQAFYRSPILIEYDLQTHQSQTIPAVFDLSFVRIGLWVRYSPDGRQILYCNFPRGVYGDTTNDSSEIGLIDRTTGKQRILDVNTSDGPRSVQLAPNWSPDGKHIVYGSGPLSIEGARGTFSLYMLRNVNEP